MGALSTKAIIIACSSHLLVGSWTAYASCFLARLKRGTMGITNASFYFRGQMRGKGNKPNTPPPNTHTPREVSILQSALIGGHNLLYVGNVSPNMDGSG